MPFLYQLLEWLASVGITATVIAGFAYLLLKTSLGDDLFVTPTPMPLNHDGK
jgi:hypothetical protein